MCVPVFHLLRQVPHETAPMDTRTQLNSVVFILSMFQLPQVLELIVQCGQKLTATSKTRYVKLSTRSCQEKLVSTERQEIFLAVEIILCLHTFRKK